MYYNLDPSLEVEFLQPAFSRTKSFDASAFKGEAVDNTGSVVVLATVSDVPIRSSSSTLNPKA